MSEHETRDHSPDPFDGTTVENLDEILDDTPTQIGPYKVLAKLGEGGFGVVYEAQQEEPVRRRVALKVIKPGMDSKKVIARFEAERQALALMTHPNISKVLGGGLTERGLPYFVMELVKGEPITDFCDRNKMTLDDRLKLLIPVCHAVQHAHAKAVIHRDLKPSNILVGYDTEGHPTPTVIDFGVAKALNQQLTEKTIYTTEGQMIGTPEYMSPEQAEMSGLDIDTRTDVYSLGVVLYELLTGMVPFGAEDLRSKAYAEMQRIIREQDPPRPSTKLSSALSVEGTHDAVILAAKRRHMSEGELSKHLKGELDWVVMKCLEKDRDRRYATPIALAEEIQHYLDDEPVLARPPSANYRFHKLVKRNRGAFVVAGLFAAILLFATGVSVRYSIIAERERSKTLSALDDRDIALDAEREQRELAEQREQEAETARAEEAKRADELKIVADFQALQFDRLNPPEMGTQIHNQLLKEFADRDEQSGIGLEETQSRIAQFDQTLYGINFTSLAINTLEQNIFITAIDALDDQFGDQPLVQAMLQQTVAFMLMKMGSHELAADLQTQALQTRQALLGDEHLDTLESMAGMAYSLYSQGYLYESEPYYLAVFEGRQQLLGDEDRSTISAMVQVGVLYEQLGEIEKAEFYLFGSYNLARKMLGNEDSLLVQTASNMGSLMEKNGSPSEAEMYYREALDIARRTLGNSNRYTMHAVFSVGYQLSQQGKYSEAEPYLLEALAGRRDLFGNDHKDTLASVAFMGKFLWYQDKDSEALVYMKEALKRRQLTLGDNHKLTIESLHDIRRFYEFKGDLIETEQYLREELTAKRRVQGDADSDTQKTMKSMCRVLRKLNRVEDAKFFYYETVNVARETGGDENESYLNSLVSLGDFLLSVGLLDEAEPHLVEALKLSRILKSIEYATTYNLGELLFRQGKLKEAEPYSREGFDRNRRQGGEDRFTTLIAVEMLLNVIDGQEHWAESEEFHRFVLDVARRAQPSDDPRVGTALIKLGINLSNQGRFSDSEPVIAECLDIRRRVMPDGHWLVWNTQSLLGDSIASQAKFAEGEKLLVEAAEHIQPPEQCRVLRTGEAIQRVINLYTAWHESEPTAGHDTQAAEWQGKLDALNAESESVEETAAP